MNIQDSSFVPLRAVINHIAKPIDVVQENASLKAINADLLAACESALKAMERATSEGATIFDAIDFGEMSSLRAVIAKAKGESK